MTFVAQVGGDHYQAEFQHWDMVAETKLGYFEANATKYLGRYNKKGRPLEDLEKSISYMEKAKQLFLATKYLNRSMFALALPSRGTATGYLRKWCQSIGISEEHDRVQFDALYLCCSWYNELEIDMAIREIHRLLTTQKEAVGGPPAGALPTLAAGAARPATACAMGAAGALLPGGGGAINHPAPFGYQED